MSCGKRRAWQDRKISRLELGGLLSYAVSYGRAGVFLLTGYGNVRFVFSWTPPARRSGDGAGYEMADALSRPARMSGREVVQYPRWNSSGNAFAPFASPTKPAGALQAQFMRTAISSMKYQEEVIISWSLTKKWSEVRRNHAPQVEERIRRKVTRNGMKLRQVPQTTQVRLAQALDIDQGAVSAIGKHVDMHVSTLRSYIEATRGQTDNHGGVPRQFSGDRAVRASARDRIRPQAWTVTNKGKEKRRYGYTASSNHGGV